MATIRRRSRGKWEVQIRKAGTNLTKTFTLKKDAQAWARKTESEIERGIYQPHPSEDRLVRDLLKRYESQVVSNQKSVDRTLSRLKVLGTYLGGHRLSLLDSVIIAQEARLLTALKSTPKVSLIV